MGERALGKKFKKNAKKQSYPNVFWDANRVPRCQKTKNSKAVLLKAKGL